MSRDFTPWEQYVVEQQQLKQGYGSLWDFMKNTTFIYKDKTFPLHSEEEINLRMQYPMLGKLLNNFEKAYSTLSKVPGGLDILTDCDNEITLYINSEQKNKNTPVIKWFLGELDESFYYGERNEELFLDYMLSEAKQLSQSKENYNNNLDKQIESAAL